MDPGNPVLPPVCMLILPTVPVADPVDSNNDPELPFPPDPDKMSTPPETRVDNPVLSTIFPVRATPSAVNMVSAPVLPLALPPLEIETKPPTVPLLRTPPADNTTLPPALESPEPTIMLIVPLRPPVEAPLVNAIHPLFPDLDEPVLNCILPDIPADNTSDVKMEMDPEPNDVLAPEPTVTDPPKPCPVVAPANISTLPPTPVLDVI
jgi:hypothetical protein